MDRFTRMFCWYCKKSSDDNTITVTFDNWEIIKSKDGWKTWLHKDGTITNSII